MNGEDMSDLWYNGYLIIEFYCRHTQIHYLRKILASVVPPLSMHCSGGISSSISRNANMLKRTCLILLIAAVPSRRMAELRQWEISGDCFIVCNSTTNVN